MNPIPVAGSSSGSSSCLEDVAAQPLSTDTHQSPRNTQTAPALSDEQIGAIFDAECIPPEGKLWIRFARAAIKAEREQRPAALSEACSVPPEGWACSRAKGHEGPCAASPEGPTTKEWCKDYPASAAWIINNLAQRIDAGADRERDKPVSCTSDPNTCEKPYCGRCWEKPDRERAITGEPVKCEYCGGQGETFYENPCSFCLGAAVAASDETVEQVARCFIQDYKVESDPDIKSYVKAFRAALASAATEVKSEAP